MEAVKASAREHLEFFLAEMCIKEAILKVQEMEAVMGKADALKDL